VSPREGFDVVDKATLDLMLSNLRRYVAVLRQLGALPRETFLANPDKVGNAKYHLVIAIECAIDVANHVISSENYRFPKDNADSFVVLVEEGVVEAGLRDRLRAMARFRNRLVHLYWEVDDPRVWEYLQTSLDDLDAFARIVADHAW
jgi:uncharacterized protein YutE (UPF0331/DUF86 family)